MTAGWRRVYIRCLKEEKKRALFAPMPKKEEKKKGQHVLMLRPISSHLPFKPSPPAPPPPHPLLPLRVLLKYSCVPTENSVR